jgi:hypothetical protein
VDFAAILELRPFVFPTPIPLPGHSTGIRHLSDCGALASALRPLSRKFRECISRYSERSRPHRSCPDSTPSANPEPPSPVLAEAVVSPHPLLCTPASQSLRGRWPAYQPPRARSERFSSCAGNGRGFVAQMAPGPPVTRQARRSAAGRPLSTQGPVPVALSLRLRTSSESAMSASERRHQQKPRARGGFAQESIQDGRLRRSRISKGRQAGMTPVIRS